MAVPETLMAAGEAPESPDASVHLCLVDQSLENILP
jgi:hypothetical protein